MANNENQDGGRAVADQDKASLDRVMTELWVGVSLGVVALVFAVVGAATWAHLTPALAAIGIGGLILLTAFAGGAFLGFLFGVPRVLSREAEATPATKPVAGGSASATPTDPAASSTAAATTQRLMRSNTNLERISDWLTTMIVGATLVEFHKVNDALLMFRAFLEQSAAVFIDAAGKPTAGVLAAAGPLLLIFGAICGFFYMYLNTRLVLVRLFNTVEGWLSDGGTRLAPQGQRAVKAVLRSGDGFGSFVAQSVTQKKSVTVDDALSVMFDLLYKSNPQRVIDLGAELQATEAATRPDYWFYMAAAFGQKFNNLPEGSAERESVRQNALDCARRAVALNPTYRDRLWRISEPGGTDDDLSGLRGDADFLRIVGRA